MEPGGVTRSERPRPRPAETVPAKLRHAPRKRARVAPAEVRARNPRARPADAEKLAQPASTQREQRVAHLRVIESIAHANARGRRRRAAALQKVVAPDRSQVRPGRLGECHRAVDSRIEVDRGEVRVTMKL